MSHVSELAGAIGRADSSALYAERLSWRASRRGS